MICVFMCVCVCDEKSADRVTDLKYLFTSGMRALSLSHTHSPLWLRTERWRSAAAPWLAVGGRPCPDGPRAATDAGPACENSSAFYTCNNEGGYGPPRDRRMCMVITHTLTHLDGGLVQEHGRQEVFLLAVPLPHKLQSTVKRDMIYDI